MSRQSSHRHPADSTHGQDGGIGPLDEVLAAVGTEIAHCASRANDLAKLIESTGSLAFNMTAEIYRDEAPCDLVQRAHGLQSLVVRGLNLLADLQSAAGRLESLAAVRGAVPEDAQQRG